MAPRDKAGPWYASSASRTTTGRRSSSPVREGGGPLLLQPHGFEGLLVAEVVERAEQHAVADCCHRGEGRLGFDSACCTAPPNLPQQHDAVVAHITNLVGFNLEAIELCSIAV